jgi:hypothetical protein
MQLLFDAEFQTLARSQRVAGHAGALDTQLVDAEDSSWPGVQVRMRARKLTLDAGSGRPMSAICEARELTLPASSCRPKSPYAGRRKCVAESQSRRSGLDV